MKTDVKIDQGIISILGRKLYSSEFSMVVLRELIQNSLDANSKNIDVFFEDYTLTVIDNGDGIEKIEGLLDTIGASIKDVSNLETIGGYGLAKLAIFGTVTWSFESKSGTFSTGYEINTDAIYTPGTKVTVQFKPEDINYSFTDRVKSYLQSINRETHFTYNQEDIKPYEMSTVLFGSREELITGSYGNNGYIVVRVNGLPTFRNWIPNLEKTVFFDYMVESTPYDDSYPLTSNRDGFLQTSQEYKDYVSRVAAIQEKLEYDKKLAEKISKQEKDTVWRNKRYVSGGNVTVKDYEKYSSEISTYERYIRQIALLHNYDLTDHTFGLSDGLQEVAYYSPSTHNFALAVGHREKGEILSVAIHEFTHFTGYSNHDQSYANRLTELAGSVFHAIFIGEFRK